MENKTITDLKNLKETLWINPNIKEVAPRFELNGKKFVHIQAAQSRLMRFMPYIERVFPETADRKGIIESNLIDIPKMAKNFKTKGKIYLKDDAHLPIAGSVKARGGIHEVLKVAEELALKNGMLKPTDDRSVLDSDKFREFYSKYTIQVGSTGNLGLSIGIMSAKLGFKVIVHMSNDAKEWKKELLKEHGVKVITYDSDYGEAVAKGREQSKADEMSHFVDDEASEDLFMGYATAALRLKVQLFKENVIVDNEHPLFVYLPCGVGGAPGGITFGLKQVFGSAVHCFFVEPVKAPCFCLGMTSGKFGGISASDIGIDGRTIADGLAVLRPSDFVCKMMDTLVSGACTVSDDALLEYQKRIMKTEGIFLEPSACAGFFGLDTILNSAAGREYISDSGLTDVMDDATHIVWATGGGLCPQSLQDYQIYSTTY